MLELDWDVGIWIEFDQNDDGLMLWSHVMLWNHNLMECGFEDFS